MASAITYGQPDGNRHPNVGALVGTFDGQTYPYCSGTLISPTVFLTAAPCGEDGTKVYVTFDSEYSSKSRLYTGTFHANELYPGAQDDPYDIVVVVFDKPIKSITPARLPTLGQVDSVAKDQKFTAVGYGGQQTVNQPGGPVIGYLDTRAFAVSTLNAVGPSYLHLSQDPATGNGGTCYGDSGGPNFLGAGITITGDSLCKSTNVIYRLDTEYARVPRRVRHAAVAERRSSGPDSYRPGFGWWTTVRIWSPPRTCWVRSTVISAGSHAATRSSRSVAARSSAKMPRSLKPQK